MAKVIFTEPRDANGVLTRTYVVGTYNVPGVGGGAEVTFNPPSIASEEAFGDFTIGQYFSPGGIASAEAFGDFIGVGGGAAFMPEGIESAEQFGAWHAIQPFTPVGIPSEEAFGAVGFKSRPEPEQIIVVLRGGPFDGESRMVGEPWPRHQIVVEDPDTGASYAYFIDVDKETEPYEATWSFPVADASTETDEVTILTGPKGDRGLQGEIGPQGSPGADGASFQIYVPALDATATGYGYAIVDDWVEAPASEQVAGYENWGYRVMGNWLIFKGVCKSIRTVPLRIVADVYDHMPPWGTQGGPVLVINTTLADTSASKYTPAYISYGGDLDPLGFTPHANLIIGGWNNVRFVLDDGILPPP